MKFEAMLAAAVPLNAEPLMEEGFGAYLTNSMLVTFIVVGGILFFARQATRRMELIPNGMQNLCEGLIEGLYVLLESIVGRHMIGKVFSFLASLFIFILISNWFGLLPGVGSIGWGEKTGPLTLSHVEVPLLRPTTADLNTTLGLAIVAMVFWLVWSIQEVGVVGLFQHIFGSKAKMGGIAGILLGVVFFFVGVLELISISTRLVSLSLRLFGNIYAGENILGTMITLGKEFGFPPVAASIMSVLVPIPFYGLELMVGLLQAFVFMLLCAVYIQLSTTHDTESH